jgi:hypothetical protein
MFGLLARKFRDWDGTTFPDEDPHIVSCLYFGFYYRGRRIRLWDGYRVLGAAVVVEDRAFRVCVYDIPAHVVKVFQLRMNPVDEERELYDDTYAFSGPVPGKTRSARGDLVGQYPLTDSDLSLSYAHFSADGTKCVFAVASATDWSNSTYQYLMDDKVEDRFTLPGGRAIYGTKIRHVEMAPGPAVVSTWEPVCTREHPIKPVWTCGISDGEDVLAEGGGEEGNIYADYAGNTLVFAQMNLRFRQASRAKFSDSHFELDPEVTKQVAEPGLQKTLKYGGDQSLIVTQMLWERIASPPPDFSYIEGRATVLHRELLWLDLRHPEDLCYSELAPDSPIEQGEHVVASRKIYLRGEVIYASGELDWAYIAGRDDSYNYYSFFSLNGPINESVTHRTLALGPDNPASQMVHEAELRCPHYQWPTDAMGFSAQDFITSPDIYEKLPNVAYERIVGTSWPSFLPLVATKLKTSGFRNTDIITGNTLNQVEVVHRTTCSFLRYRGEYICQIHQPFYMRFNGAGETHTSEFNHMLVTDHPGVDSDDQWILRSSLDLPTLTGVDNLSPNIWPLGVI